MVEKRFEKLGMPDIERFENYLPTAFNSELTLLQKVNKIIFDLIKNNNLTNEMVEYLNNFINTFDDKLYTTVKDVLNVWLEDGILADIVREELNRYIDEFNTQLERIENKGVVTTLGKKGIMYAGVIRNDGTGWKFIDDTIHNNINFKTIETTLNNEIKVTYEDSKKIGSMIVGTDEYLASHGVSCGASVGDYQAFIKCYADFEGSIGGDGSSIINNNEWFQNTYTFTKMSDGTGFKISYDGGTGDRVVTTAIPSRSGDTTTTHSALDVLVSKDSANKSTLRAYSDLYAHIGYDGANWNVTTSCVANIKATWNKYSDGNLTITHDSLPSDSGYNLFQSVNVNMRVPLSGAPINIYIERVSQTEIRISFYDVSGTKITTPNTNMRFFISRPNFKVPHVWSNNMRCYFNLGRTIIRPNQFTSASGNLWLLGLHQAN